MAALVISTLRRIVDEAKDVADDSRTQSRRIE
jgi:hypothetical protein